jgi:PKD repeat protein
MAIDSVVISRSTKTIAAQFLVSSRDTVNKSVQFINLSSPEPISQTWFFGDGLTSNAFNPSHIYVLPQDYTIALEVNNGFCTDRIEKSLNVLFREGIERPKVNTSKLELRYFSAVPNPTEREVNIILELNNEATVTMIVTDLTGRQIITRKMESTIYTSTLLTLGNAAAGLYQLHLLAQSEKGNILRTVKLVKTQ